MQLTNFANVYDDRKRWIGFWARDRFYPIGPDFVSRKWISGNRVSRGNRVLQKLQNVDWLKQPPSPEMHANLRGFFDTLAQWTRREDGGDGKDPQ